MVLAFDIRKRSFGFLFIGPLFGLALLCLYPPASRADAQLSVSSVIRITHPAYRVSNMWYGERNPWNRNHTRLLLHENMGFTDTLTGRKGRGHAWGFVKDLKSWTTLEEYESVAHPLHLSTCWQSLSLFWSPLAGEEHILYGVYTCERTVSKLNVDTGVRTVVASFDPGDGTSVSTARAFGFTSDNHFVVNFDNESRSSGGYEVAIPGGAKTRFNEIDSDCSATRKRWPQALSSGHAHRSPDGELCAQYGSGSGQVGVQAFRTGIDCSTLYVDRAYPNPDQAPTHVSWTYSNDWFVAENMGSWGGWQTSPYLSQDSIFQITFDRITNTFTYNTLLTTTTAGFRSSGGTDYNYHAIPIPVLRNDGKQMIFWSTDGKYSYDDYQADGVTPWGTEGMFLVDFGL